MIKYTAGREGGGLALVGFALTAKNVEELKRGHPIFVMGAEMGLPFDVAISYGETEQEIYADMKKAGAIDPERTVLHDTSRRKRN